MLSHAATLLVKCVIHKGEIIIEISIRNNINSVTINLSGERLKREQRKYNEIVDNILVEAKESGYFKEEFIPLLTERIRNVSQVGISYKDPFDKSDCITLEEKKKLNLNTRAKYSRELINGLTEKGIKAAQNQEFIKNMFYRNFHKVFRKFDLEELKEMGLKYVCISCCNDEQDCKSVKKIKKRWLIQEVPELPLPQCDCDFCRCMYIADGSELAKLL